MLLVTVGGVFLVGALFLRVLRPLFWVILFVALALVFLPQIPLKSPTFQSLALVLSLVRHVLWQSIQQGLHQYRSWGTHLLKHSL